MREGCDYTFWVYILTSSTGMLYIGITGYIDRRISQHKMGSIEGFFGRQHLNLVILSGAHQTLLFTPSLKGA